MRVIAADQLVDVSDHWSAIAASDLTVDDARGQRSSRAALDLQMPSKDCSNPAETSQNTSSQSESGSVQLRPCVKSRIDYERYSCQ